MPTLEQLEQARLECEEERARGGSIRKLLAYGKLVSELLASVRFVDEDGNVVNKDRVPQP